MEVTNRFKGLDQIDRVAEELWMEVHNIVQEAEIKIIPKEKKCKKAEWLSEGALKITEQKSERQRRKEKYTSLNEEFKELQVEIRKPS